MGAELVVHLDSSSKTSNAGLCNCALQLLAQHELAAQTELQLASTVWQVGKWTQ